MVPRIRVFIWSAVLTIVSVSICSLVFSAGWIYLLEVSTHFLFLALAVIFLVLRLTFFLSREQFIYIFTGTMNLGLGLLSLGSYLIGYVTKDFPEMMSINLLLGLIMLIDALVLKRRPYEKASS